MGPRPFSRGNGLTDDDLATLFSASMGPRPFSRGNNPALGRYPRKEPSFNGAAAVQPRKFDALRGGGGRAPPASMGPRPFSRGNPERQPPS